LESFAALLDQALSRRTELLVSLGAEGTDAWRVFHGAVEGLPGVVVDRYGDLLLVQLFRAAPGDLQVEALVEAVAARAAACGPGVEAADGGEAAAEIVVVDRRGGTAALEVDASRARREEFVAHEGGMKFLVRARHEGQDPWLFLDLRAGRRALRELASGRSVLNLFAYTCTAGIAAALAGATEVQNVDFSAKWLDVGRRNARLNELRSDRVRFLREDCLAVLRQLAGQKVGRYGQAERHTRIEPRTYDVVVLDPPRLSRSSLGRVDLVSDYQTLFKPAWLSVAEGGHLLATNNVASVALDAWLDQLRRCADKAGRPIRSIDVITPDADFPSPDGRPPLKLAVCGG
jgi:23S rRNA (cytosine1962-C5)-methyltransferase